MRHLIKSPLGRFRLIGYAEGISLLILLSIAMPIKYLAGNPYPVKVGGWIHGVLFILYLYHTYIVKEEYHWQISRLLLAIIAAFIPFGTFAFDKWLKKQYV